MTLNQYIAKLETRRKSIAEGRSRNLNGWEEGYTTALKETIRDLGEVSDKAQAVMWEKRRWVVTQALFSKLAAVAASPEEIDAAVQTAIYAGGLFVQEYKLATTDG